MTMDDHKHIPFELMFGDTGYNTPHTMPNSNLLALLGYANIIISQKMAMLHTFVRE
jgi:hypothetical protein